MTTNAALSINTPSPSQTSPCPKSGLMAARDAHATARDAHATARVSQAVKERTLRRLERRLGELRAKPLPAAVAGIRRRAQALESVAAAVLVTRKELRAAESATRRAESATRRAELAESRARTRARTRLLRSLDSADLAHGASRNRGVFTEERWSLTGDDCVQEILRRVGPAGEQARADEARYTEEEHRETDGGKRGGVCGGDHREVSHAWIARDGRSAILAYVEWGSWGVSGARARNGQGRGGLHHLRIRAYLVVRDSTSGDRHMIRVPPRFGRRSATDRGMGWRAGDARPVDSAARRIHAATAWTFGLRPAEYHPDVEA